MKIFNFAGLVAVAESAFYFTVEPPKFEADHPFVYHIWDRQLKTPIFSGHITRLEWSKILFEWNEYNSYSDVNVVSFNYKRNDLNKINCLFEIPKSIGCKFYKNIFWSFVFFVENDGPDLTLAMLTKTLQPYFSN